MIDLGLNAAEFNVTTATCCGCCVCCSGVTCIVICPNPGAGFVNQEQQAYAYEYYSYGGQSDITGQALWNSENTSIVTEAGGGWTTGVAVGTTYIDAFYNAPPGGQICDCIAYCPSKQKMEGRGEADVASFTASKHTYPSGPFQRLPRQHAV
ncbi:MAG: hypothetical protein ACRD18_00730 [Terriglobia bacterium]